MKYDYKNKITVDGVTYEYMFNDHGGLCLHGIVTYPELQKIKKALRYELYVILQDPNTKDWAVYDNAKDEYINWFDDYDSAARYLDSMFDDE